jgi:protein-S-isoprenylcysteine O-methyltransferase Ste14
MFALAVLCSNALQLLLWSLSGWAYLVLHAASWAAWFVWQGWVFPRARERYLAAAEDRAYAAAFYRQIWPGVSLGVSHMSLPVVSSLAHPSSDSPVSMAVGVLLAGAGVAMLWAGFRTIGIAQAGFVGEYKPVHGSMTCRSIYALMRHPLFVGGALLSFGGVFLLGAHPGDLRLAALNLLILPVYRMIEDRRLTRVFGVEYAAYSSRVGGIMPRRAHVAEAFFTIVGMRRVARQH